MSRWRPPAESSSALITADGLQRLQHELDELWRVRRPEVVAALTAAAALLAWQLGLWEQRFFWPDFEKEARSLARLLLWFTWPTWPLALWTLWRWRNHIFIRPMQRHLWIPLWFSGCALGAMLLSRPADRALLLGLPTLAALAAFALPTLKRSVSALIDWFTLLFFSISAIAIWVIWISTQTGFPAKPAANVVKLAEGFRPEFSAVALAVALAATAAWCTVVVWRTGRSQSALWKTLVLPAAGTTLCWLLLTTLWLPMLNYARSDAPRVRDVLTLTGAAPCLHVLGLDQSQFAALQIFGGINTQPLTAAKPTCPWLVIADDASTPALRRTPPDPGEWVLEGRIGRPTDRNDALVVYRQKMPSSMNDN